MIVPLKSEQQIAVPEHLRPETQAWFRRVTTNYLLEEHHVRLLTLACQAWDRAENAREAIAEHGEIFIDRFGSPKARPEVAIERDARIGFARLVRELDLDTEAPPDRSRPPALRSNRR